jgi:hypothetical protein
MIQMYDIRGKRRLKGIPKFLTEVSGSIIYKTLEDSRRRDLQKGWPGTKNAVLDR